MADTKITALAAITTVAPANDLLPIVDVDDHSMAASGTTKNITVNQILGSGGTATLASATITGDLTVDTNTLYVNSSTDRVLIGTLSALGSAKLSIAGKTQADTAVAGDVIGNFNNTSATGYGFRIGGGSATGGYALSVNNNAGSEFHQISGTGIATWSNVGGVAGTAMTLNSTGLGVGGNPTAKLDVVGEIKGTNSGVSHSFSADANYGWMRSTGTNLGLLIGTTDAKSVNIVTGNTIRTTVDTAGNVGIGVAPSAYNASWRALDIFSTLGLIGGSATSIVGHNLYIGAASALIYKTTNFASYYQQQNGIHSWYTAPSGTAGTTATFTQAMTLDASGNLLVGQTTAALDAQGGFYFRNAAASGGSSMIVNHRSAVTGGNSYAEFTHNGIGIGSITQNGTTGVLYNINSDYRLKESVAPLSGGLARVNALKPSIYKWKSDGSSGEGFLAHELAEVVPFAVTGEKDAVNEDGSIKSQGIDMSRVVPILVAAIQELAAEVNALKNA